MQLSLLSQLLVVSTAAALVKRNTTTSNVEAVWQPEVGARFQIILDRRGIGSGRYGIDQLVPDNADIFDVDLFDTPKELIQSLQKRGKKVICYFSAGGSESWRPDFSSIQEKDKGLQLPGWARENWLDIRSPDVFEVMKKRIEMAATKGCDGIDPDNIDAFGDESRRGGGFAVKLTAQDTVTYVKKLAAEAHSKGLAIGLKNAETLLPTLASSIQFAVNEECATYYGGCSSYTKLLNSGKPVFHIEYARTKVNQTGEVEISAESQALRRMTAQELTALYCLETGIQNRRWVSTDVAKRFSTVIKGLSLSKWVLYCDGQSAGNAKEATGRNK